MDPTRLKLWLISTLLRIFLLIDRGKSEIIREELTRSITPNMITNLFAAYKKGENNLGKLTAKGLALRKKIQSNWSFFSKGAMICGNLLKKRL
jgi:hypothetical protein